MNEWSYTYISTHVCGLLRDNSTYTLRRLNHGQPYARDALSPAKDPHCRLNRRLSGSHIRSGRFGGENILYPCWDLGGTACQYSLYRQSHRGHHPHEKRSSNCKFSVLWIFCLFWAHLSSLELRLHVYLVAALIRLRVICPYIPCQTPC